MSGRLQPMLSQRAATAIKQALGVDADPDVRETTDARFGDYQINGVLPLAKRLRENPRALATRVVEALDLSEMCEEPEIAGPGFINLHLKPQWLAGQIDAALGDDRLGIEPVEHPESIVIDFSSPNVAKRMHAGHLRSTIIGDAIARTLRFLGHKVTGDNHVGDWGTQFGTLLWAWERHADEAALARDAIGELERLYKLGCEASQADETVAAACRAELVALQQGDVARRALWERFVAISRADAETIYERMSVSFDTWHGESFYHDALPGVVSDLQARGLAQESEGAIAVFFEDIEKMADKPFLIRKSDGAFLYATTDLATLNYRVEHYAPTRVIYVVDVRQSLHFNQLFETFRRMGNTVDLQHVGFGMMLGSDGRPFRTRDGGTISLAALLDEAESRILPKVKEKWPQWTDEERHATASEVGMGAVKYADLSHNLTTDYRFEWDKLLAADGNTGPYLQYTVCRLRSVLREYESRFGETFVVAGTTVSLDAPEEIALAKSILKLGDTLDAVSRTLRPHFLCDAVYGIARSFNPFYAKCSILGAPDEATRRSRLALCHATVRAMEIGLNCLNIPMLDKM